MPVTKTRRDERRLDFAGCLPSTHLDEELCPVPTFTGATQWLDRHKEYIEKIVQLLQTYPNLIKNESLDRLWALLEPLVDNTNLLREYEQYIRLQFTGIENFEVGISHSDPLPTPLAWLKNNRVGQAKGKHNRPRSVYFCFAYDDPGVVKSSQALMQSMSPHCHVRCNPNSPTHELNTVDLCQAISCANAFLFFIDANSIEDDTCLHLLSMAISYEVPIVMIREPAFKIPVEFPPHVTAMEATVVNLKDLKPRTGVPQKFEFTVNQSGGRPKSSAQRVTSPSDDVTARPKTSHVRRSDHKNSAGIVRQHAKTSNTNGAGGSIIEEETSAVSVSDVLTRGYINSLVYVRDFHDSCADKLFDMLSEYLGGRIKLSGGVAAREDDEDDTYDEPAGSQTVASTLEVRDANTPSGNVNGDVHERHVEADNPVNGVTMPTEEPSENSEVVNEEAVTDSNPCDDNGGPSAHDDGPSDVNAKPDSLEVKLPNNRDDDDSSVAVSEIDSEQLSEKADDQEAETPGDDVPNGSEEVMNPDDNIETPIVTEWPPKENVVA